MYIQNNEIKCPNCNCIIEVKNVYLDVLEVCTSICPKCKCKLLIEQDRSLNLQIKEYNF